MLALGVVAGADDVEPQAIFQIVGLVPLHARRGGIADIGPALVPIEAVEVDQLPVQVEAVRPKFRVPEAHPQGPPIRFLALVDQGDGQFVQPGVVQVPGDRVLGRKGEGILTLGVHGKVHAQLRQGELQGIARIGGPVQLYLDLSFAVGMGHGEHVRDVAGLCDLQPGLPV